MPRFRHAGRLHAHDRSDFVAGGGDFRVAQLTRSPAFAEPIGGESGLAAGGADVDVAAKANDVSEA